MTDRLRCNSNWNKTPRYDSVIVNNGDSGSIICKLVRAFTYTVTEEQQSYALLLVQPLDAPIVNPRPGDFEIGLCRLRERSRTQSRVIPARSVIRAALIVEDPMHAGEYTVVDTIDTDMFLRCMDLFPDRDIEQVV